MEYIVVSLSALFVSAIALYSGFGLGTLLMPVFALFFPLPIAVASTAIVHMANNIFRVAFVGRSADWGIVLSFGLPAVLLAFPGALLLVRMAEIDSLATYTLANREFSITAIKLIIAVLILGFALFELVPAFQRVEVPRKFIPLGGALSGFFGGLCGGAFSASGPPVLIYATAAGWARDHFRANLQVFFMSTAILGFIGFIKIGLVNRETLPITITCLPGVVLGGLLGDRLATRLPQESFRSLVTYCLLAMGFIYVFQWALN